MLSRLWTIFGFFFFQTCQFCLAEFWLPLPTDFNIFNFGVHLFVFADAQCQFALILADVFNILSIDSFCTEIILMSFPLISPPSSPSSPHIPDPVLLSHKKHADIKTEHFLHMSKASYLRLGVVYVYARRRVWANAWLWLTTFPSEVREKTSGSGTTEINDIITATRGK